MFSFRMSTKHSSRNALTLIELLVVVSIVTLLSAITLPTLRTVMSQRKTSQAAILVKNMLETARARAIARGRNVSVVVERLSSRATRDGTGAIVPAFAENSASENNYAAYNTSLRMSLAESPPPVEFDSVNFTLNGSGLTLENPILTDARFNQVMSVGVEVEFPDLPAIGRRLTVGVVGTPKTTLTVDNYDTSNPTLMATQVDAVVALRRAVKPAVANMDWSSASLKPGTRMIVYPVPTPVASQVVDMPRGSCIDLSLSGLGSNVRWNVPAGIQDRIDQRDTRRQFASDWAYTIDYTRARNTTDNIEPTPQDLRPVYLVFGPDGTLSSVYSNGFTLLVGNATLQQYDTREDVYLFVGRTDQVVRTKGAPVLTDDTSIYPATLEDARIKANINDTSCQWIRISPKSGAISVANVASAYDSPLPTGTLPTATSFSSIGQVLYVSRMLSFADEATAQ